MGDGTMKDGGKFAHDACYWRSEVARLERIQPTKQVLQWAVQAIEAKYNVFPTEEDGKNLCRLRTYANAAPQDKPTEHTGNGPDTELPVEAAPIGEGFSVDVLRIAIEWIDDLIRRAKQDDAGEGVVRRDELASFFEHISLEIEAGLHPIASSSEPAKAESPGLESVRCAYINLNNMVKMMPVLGRHPLLPMVKMQLRTTIEALGDKEFCDMEDG